MNDDLSHTPPLNADDTTTPPAPDAEGAAVPPPPVAATARPRRRGTRPVRLAAFSTAGALLLTAGAGVGALASIALRDADTTTAVGGSASSTIGGSATGAADDGSGSANSSSGSGTAASASQSLGVVTIDTRLGYEGGSAAGTGIVLTSTGEVLTNNHVISGATDITVTVVSTGRSYPASVVGTDATDDVALLQVTGASGLQTAQLASTVPSSGESVTAIGNAGGSGTLTTAQGAVTGLDQTITTQAEGNAMSETLHGLIETNADVVAGDSGGPLVNASGEVVGIDTAASSSGQVQSYAIPTGDALTIVRQIRSGTESSTVTIGYPAFLGVEVDGRRRNSSATVAGVIDGTPAASAGLAVGDVITAVGNKAVTTGSELTSALQAYKPGDYAAITFQTSAGTTRTIQVTLAKGPAN